MHIAHEQWSQDVAYRPRVFWRQNKGQGRRKKESSVWGPQIQTCPLYVLCFLKMGAFRIILIKTLFANTWLFTSVPTHHMYIGINSRSDSIYGCKKKWYIHLNPQVGWLGNDKITCVRLFSLYRLHHICVGANLRGKGRQAGKETQRHKEENSNGFSLSSECLYIS